MKKLTEAELSPTQTRVYEAIVSGPRGGVRGPLAVWLHRPELANKAQQLGQYCRYESSLPPRLRELAILTTAKLWNAHYEWDIHISFAEKYGLSPEVIEALSQENRPKFLNKSEEVVYNFTQELYATRSISDETFAATILYLGQDQTLDLVGLLGYYSLISMTVKAFSVSE